MTTVVANTNEDLAIPYSFKKQILYTYEKRALEKNSVKQ
jgi:hypothetical protein